MAEDKQPRRMSLNVRYMITLGELVITAVLLWFPVVSLRYDALWSTDCRASVFVENTAWALPFSLVEWLFWVALAAACVPLVVRQVNRFWTMVALTAAAALSFGGHIGLLAVCFFTVGEKTVYGMAPYMVPTTVGALYAVFGVFSLIEAVCTCVAIRREAGEEGEVLSDGGDE